MAKKSPRELRIRRHKRLRKNVVGSAERPRLCVFRSNLHIYAQIIDDQLGHTLVAASTIEQNLGELVAGQKKVAQAAIVGRLVAERALQAGVTKVVFDRGGYQYHGRVEAVAKAAREAGLDF